MTNKAKNTHITAHVAGSDFAPKFTWTVANNNNMVEKEFVEYIGRVPNISYYEDKGYTDVKVEETGEKFARKYKVTMKMMMPKVTTFDSEREARRYAKTLS